MKDILTGELVRFSAVDPDEFSKSLARWERDSEFMRLLEAQAFTLKSATNIKDRVEKELAKENHSLFWFSIRALQNDQLLGDIVLHVTSWNHHDAFIGVGIGERDFWGKGFGTEVMELILRFAFIEANLRRVTLTVFEYNPRAIRTYEKVGFKHEGRMRSALLRDGKRWDMLYMSILYDEWIEKYGYLNSAKTSAS